MGYKCPNCCEYWSWLDLFLQEFDMIEFMIFLDHHVKFMERGCLNYWTGDIYYICSLKQSVMLLNFSSYECLIFLDGKSTVEQIGRPDNRATEDFTLQSGESSHMLFCGWTHEDAETALPPRAKSISMSEPKRVGPRSSVPLSSLLFH